MSDILALRPGRSFVARDVATVVARAAIDGRRMAQSQDAHEEVVFGRLIP